MSILVFETDGSADPDLRASVATLRRLSVRRKSGRAMFREVENLL